MNQCSLQVQQFPMTNKNKEETSTIRLTYRDRIYIRKDIISTLVRYGELNQSKLVSYCNLNNTNLLQVIYDLVQKGMISRKEEKWGSKVVIKYGVSEKGKRFLLDIMLPYEELFPRVESTNLDKRDQVMSKQQEEK